MANTAVLYTRIDPNLKSNAESILAQLGITPAAAIQMFYSQIILQNGLPFEAKLPSGKIAANDMTDDEKIDVVAANILDRYKAAFEELAK